MTAIVRPAARVLCVDAEGRVLLLRWRDPSNGAYLWEPPGGGIDPGERPIDTARRELVEETGLPADAVGDLHVMVARDVWWNGNRYGGEEAFFLARFERPTLVRGTGLQDHERAWLQGHAWVHWSDLEGLPEKVEPPGLVGILGMLDPEGPWSGGVPALGAGEKV